MRHIWVQSIHAMCNLRVPVDSPWLVDSFRHWNFSICSSKTWIMAILVKWVYTHFNRRKKLKMLKKWHKKMTQKNIYFILASISNTPSVPGVEIIPYLTKIHYDLYDDFSRRHLPVSRINSKVPSVYCQIFACVDILYSFSSILCILWDRYWKVIRNSKLLRLR